MAALFGFGGIPVEIEIKLAGEEGRKQVEQKVEKDKKELCPVYYDNESVTGQVSLISRRPYRNSEVDP